jgi:transposase
MNHRASPISPTDLYDKKKRSKRTKYDFIDSEKRRLLLHYVDTEKKTIKEAANELQINYSSAKTILQFYRKSGRIERLNGFPSKGCEENDQQGEDFPN